MAGLADLFGMGDSGGMFGGGTGGLYGDLLTPEMKQQMAFRGLMAAAGAFGQAAMPSRMPVPIGAALGSAAAAMAGAQDQGLENALKTALTSGKLQELKSQIAARAAGTRDLADVAKMMGGLGAPATPSGAPQPLAPEPVAPGADTIGGGIQSGDSLGGGMTAGGALTGKISDPRGLVPFIKETAAKYGIEPDVAVKVAQSEGLGTFYGDGGKSGTAFQLYTGGGLGNEFQKETGLDPLDPKNERVAIDYALRKASQVGWSPWHGAKKVGIAEWQGIGRSSPDSVIASDASQVPLVQVAQTAPLTSLPAAAPVGQPGVTPMQAPTPPPASPDAARLQTMLQALALKNAAMGLAGDKQPYNSLIGVLQGSPQYKAAVESAAEWAKNAPLTARAYGMPEANPTLQGQIAGEKEKATAAAAYGRPDFNQALQRALGLDKAAANAGGTIGPSGFAMVPNYSEALAGAAGQKASAEAIAQQAARVAAEQQITKFNLDPNAIGPAATAPTGDPVDAAAAAVKSGAPAGPGVTEPVPTPHGTAIPPIAAAAPIVGSPDYLRAKQSGKGGWADTENDWAASRPMAKKAEEAALVVADVLKTYQSGAFAGQLSDIRAKLRAVGIDLPESVAGDPAAAQKIVKQNFSQTISSMKGFDSNPAAYQIKLAFENWANANLQPEANLAILAQSVGLARWQEKLQQDFGEAKKLGWRDPQDFMLKWDQLPQNSLKSFVERATQEIGPLKGAPGAPPAGTVRRSYFDPKTGTIRPVE